MTHENIKNRTKRKVSRREALRLVGAAVASSAVLTSTSFAQPISHEATEDTSAAPDEGTSVFLDPCVCNNGLKYATYDKTTIYPIIAFWLMLTTDNWDGCMSSGAPIPQSCPDATPKKTPEEAKAWRLRLAQELGVASDYVEYLYNQYHNDKRLNKAFRDVRGVFQRFIEAPPKTEDKAKVIVYGAHPCLGGKTLLQIAALKGS